MSTACGSGVDMKAVAEVRDAEEGDLEAVSKLLGETWHATYDSLYGAERVADLTRRWHSVATLVRELADPHVILLVACREASIIGTASTQVDPAASKLNRLYVHPSAQGQGTGTALLAAVADRLPRDARITLEVDPQNRRAIGFYERHGFAVTGKTGDCCGCGDRIPALIMTRGKA